MKDWTTDSVSLSWADGPQSLSVLYYNVEYQRLNDVRGVVAVNRKIYGKQTTVENLMSDTNYQFHVIAGDFLSISINHPKTA